MRQAKNLMDKTIYKFKQREKKMQIFIQNSICNDFGGLLSKIKFARSDW